MKIYTVGGAVRDGLLGLPVQDRDHVVVGATPQAMEHLGYRAVGRDFPVFLHPQTHEEYALARTERKVGRGYKGFTVHAAPEVTLEEDLARRDLTINAMARADDGTLIDPYGGERDLRAGVLRHVGPAFVEDPVRILRVARFAARFDFRLAPETLELMRSMVAAGETGALVPERVWQELSRGLLEAAPQRMLRVLHACGLAPQWLPELALAWQGAPGATVPQALTPADELTRVVEAALAQAAALAQPLAVRFALLAFALRGGSDNKAAEAQARGLAARLRADNDSRDALVLAARHGAAALAIGPPGTAEAALVLIEGSDALRRPERLRGLLAACACVRAARGEDHGAATAWMGRMLAAAAGIDAAAIAAAGPPAQIAQRLRAARLAAMTAVTG